MTHRYVFGLLGPRCSGAARKKWNALLEDRAIDGFFDFYPTKSKADLELRLSEMFHLGRAAYVLASSLSAEVSPLLDGVDASVSEGGGAIDTVINEGGILRGYSAGHLGDLEQLSLWMKKFQREY